MNRECIETNQLKIDVIKSKISFYFGSRMFRIFVKKYCEVFC